MTIVELCKMTDKEAAKLLVANLDQGLEIIKFQNKYYTYFHEPLVWRAKDAEFKKVNSGLYAFIKGDDNAYYVS